MYEYIDTNDIQFADDMNGHTAITIIDQDITLP